MLHKDGDKASLDKVKILYICISVAYPTHEFQQNVQEKFTSVVKRKRVRPDAVMIMTSDKLGECGELQAYFDKMGVPFTFSGVEETKVRIRIQNRI